MCVYCGVVAVLSRCVFSAFASSKVPETRFRSNSQGEAPKVCPTWSARDFRRPPRTVSALSYPRFVRPVGALRRCGAREGGESPPGSTRPPRLAGMVVGSLRHARHPAWLPGGRNGKLPRHGAGPPSMTFSCVSCTSTPRARCGPGDPARLGARLMRRLRHGSARSENTLARWSVPRYDGPSVSMHGKADSIMTIKMRRLVVVVPVASIMLLANFLALGEWLSRAGVIGWAQSIHTEYITGTAIAVIAALLILLPSASGSVCRSVPPIARCPVCDEPLERYGNYCSACGSRI